MAIQVGGRSYTRAEYTDPMTLQREPMGPDGLPFDRVVDELGYVHVQCAVCGDHSRVMDGLAATALVASRFGRVRLWLQMPWLLGGAAKFLLRHGECTGLWNAPE